MLSIITWYFLFITLSLASASVSRFRPRLTSLIFLPLSHLIDIRTARFLDRFSTSENILCNVLHDQAWRHTSELSIKFDIGPNRGVFVELLRNVINKSFFDVNIFYAEEEEEEEVLTQGQYTTC